jgi:hypothetical protein
MEKRLGDVTFEYFKGAFLEVVRIEFPSDDMSCEAFRDAIFRNEVKLSIIDKIFKRHRFSFEAVIEEGAFYIRVSGQLISVALSAN